MTSDLLDAATYPIPCSAVVVAVTLAAGVSGLWRSWRQRHRLARFSLRSARSLLRARHVVQSLVSASVVAFQCTSVHVLADCCCRPVTVSLHAICMCWRLRQAECEPVARLQAGSRLLRQIIRPVPCSMRVAVSRLAKANNCAQSVASKPLATPLS